MKEKFVIFADSHEIPESNICRNCSLNFDGDHWPEAVAEFATEAEAVEALKNLHTEIRYIGRHGSKQLFNVTEYSVEKRIYDEEEEEWAVDYDGDDGQSYGESEPAAELFNPGSIGNWCLVEDYADGWRLSAYGENLEDAEE